jgi:hypothetical protein
MMSALRFRDTAGVLGAGPAPSDAGTLEPPERLPDDLLKEKPRENVSERLKGILDSRGRSTGADAQI